MGRYWNDQEIDRITPPQINDIRGHAILRALDRAIADRPLRDFFIRDAYTVPAAMLPALIAEYSLEEFITPDLPESFVRKIIANQWFLHEGKGYDDGVLLGLSLLGMSATIIQWYQQTPIAPTDTHIITFSVDELLFADGDGHFDQRQIKAAQQMIDATKRWSQDSEIRASVNAPGPVYSGAFATTHLVAEARPDIPPAPILMAANKYAVVPTTQIRAVAQTN